MLKNLKLSAVAGLLAVGGVLSAAQAAPITYIEGINGDLPFNGPGPNLVLDVGLNTVTGTTDLSDFDSFAFTVPSGLQVVSLRAILTDGVGDYTGNEWDLRTGSTIYSGTLLDSTLIASPGFHDYPVPLNAGSYNFGDTLKTQNGNSTATYTFAFEVHPVPEPTSLLAVAGLPLLLRRRRK